MTLIQFQKKKKTIKWELSQILNWNRRTTLGNIANLTIGLYRIEAIPRSELSTQQYLDLQAAIRAGQRARNYCEEYERTILQYYINRKEENVDNS